MTRTALIAALFGAIPMVANAAPCGERTDVLAYLSTKFEESPIAMGLTSDGKVLEVLASEAGSWSIIVTMPTGVTCGLSFGESWSKALDRNVEAGEIES